MYSPTSNTSNTGALFDVLGAINGPHAVPKHQSKLSKPVTLQYHIFNGTYGWMIKESRKQPSIILKLTTNKQDYDCLNLSCPVVRPSKISAITDTGAQSSSLGLKKFRSRIPTFYQWRRSMQPTMKESIFLVLCLHGYLELTRKVRRSKLLTWLRIRHNWPILPKPPHDGATENNIFRLSYYSWCFIDRFANSTAISWWCISNEHSPSWAKMQMFKARPEKLPFPATDENNENMKLWLLERYSMSTFNQCPHQPLPMMTGPPITINIDPEATSTTIHSPAPIPIHWRDEVKKQLDADVALGVIEKKEPNTPTTWCHRAIWVRKSDGSPRRVVDFQTLNRHCLRDTHHTVPPFNQARAIPHDTYRSVTDGCM